MAHRLFGHERPLDQVQMPKIPVEGPSKYMQNLIPRLTQTIKDIDELQFRIGWGAQEGLMDNWSSLLTAYSILLTRIQAISTSFSQAAVIAKPSQPAPDPSSSEASSSTPAPIPVPLNRILLHPRLPQTTDTTDFLTVIALTTQQPFPAVKQAQDDLIKKALEEEGQEPNGVQGKTDEELESMLDALKSRLGREHNRASLVADYIRGLEDEYEWQGRIDDEDDAEDEAQDSAGEGKGGDGTAAKPVTIDVDMDESNKKADEDTKARWTLDDWVRYRETGRQPAS